MTSKERKQARHERRNAKREAKWNVAVAAYDDFNNVADADNLFKSFRRSRCSASIKGKGVHFAIKNITYNGLL